MAMRIASQQSHLHSFTLTNNFLDNNNNNTTTAGEDYHELKQVEIKTNYTDTPSSQRCLFSSPRLQKRNDKLSCLKKMFFLLQFAWFINIYGASLMPKPHHVTPPNKISVQKNILSKRKSMYYNLNIAKGTTDPRLRVFKLY